MEEEKLPLFDIDTKWQEEWKGMPEYNMKRVKPILTIKVNFATQEDIDKFQELFGIKITKRIREYWFPKLNITTSSDQVYIDEP